ncbi:hypothetical protein D3C75_1388580 [compost metagenome]
MIIKMPQLINKVKAINTADSSKDILAPVTTAALIVPGPIINGIAMVLAKCAGVPLISPMVSAP